MKNVFWICSALLVLNGCGQAYDVVKNNNSALLGYNHIEGDIGGGGEPGVGLPTPNPTPVVNATPTPSNPQSTPTPSNPQATPTPSNPGDPGQSPSPAPSPGNPGASPTPSNPGNPGASPTPGNPGTPGQSPSPAPSPGNPGNPDGDDPSDLSKCGKGSKKVLICHIPKGNPANAHTLCLSKQGAMHGHGVPMDGSASAFGDYLGTCTGPAPAGSGHRSGRK